MTARDPSPAAASAPPPEAAPESTAAPAAPTPRKKRRAALATQPVERIQRSLFGEILDWMLAPLLLLWPMSIAITYLIAQSIANQPFDRALEDSVTVLAQQVAEVNGKVVARLPVSARDLLRADDIDNIYYKVTGPNGEYVEGDVDMPQPPADEDRITLGTVQFRNDILHGSDVRIATLQVDLRRSAAQRAAQREPRIATVQVGETLEKRAQLANEIIKGVILPQFVILPVALALVWFALSRGLSPLSELQQRIRARRPDDLSPIDSGQVPEEISPLVRSLNDMLARLSQTIAIQKRFIADAAHQMKTPLAGMRMQSELALRQDDQDDVRRSLEQLAKSSETATRLVNQLLSLARAENQQSQSGGMAALELSELARSVVQDWVPMSFTQRIDLGFEQPDHPILITGNPVMLRELLSNLLDNALHYTPHDGNGRVTVRARTDEGGGLAILEVEDNGPGIPVAERTNVFERFYRILGTPSTGSGLGLAIVREIAQQHEAIVEITHNPRSSDPKYPGSLFRVSFRMMPRTPFFDDIT
ncbi:sensor histidine kinase [Herbaspirillum sp.]|jgi:two-component system sensor histidine kinase TctE|uniref:sensor histidine kinase n=1 Tax=Herbaspirillum TaxID=963 RepID=UPI0025854DAF|nr:sensor histidine kinase [Herbaspirillum sp.]MCP3658310.1 sensor histidine kinase [Herbaspirillum sp.]MCP3950254.1 sensor histidine kinase [Herbaspirillum sp.]MCP4033662.1 sensor histidine kinase [Herbaspirillum sp.]MCP4554959.1 sensor histidine kinase [Herbaspirillum sp.]